MAKYKVLATFFEGDKPYSSGDTIELTAKRAKEIHAHTKDWRVKLISDKPIKEEKVDVGESEVGESEVGEE